MNRQLKRIFNDIDLLGINGGYDVEQLLTPNDCRMLKYEIEKLNKKYNDYRNYVSKQSGYQTKDCLVRERDLLNERIEKAINYIDNWKKENYIHYMNCEDNEIKPFDLKKLKDILKGSDKE